MNLGEGHSPTGCFREDLNSGLSCLLVAWEFYWKTTVSTSVSAVSSSKLKEHGSNSEKSASIGDRSLQCKSLFPNPSGALGHP